MLIIAYFTIDYLNELPDLILLVLLLFTVPFLVILKFKNKSKSIGFIALETKHFHITVNNQETKYKYDSIEKIQINNYEGQRQTIISTLNLYPYNDGLDNYITLTNGVKFEILIKNKKNYSIIKNHFSVIRKGNKNDVIK